MAIACPVGLDGQVLRQAISKLYSGVAVQPDGEFHFHRGPEYAAEFLGYDQAELAALPPECSAAFAGIGNPHRIGSVEPGETVLDIGSGTGTDVLIAARKVGPSGRAIGVDMTGEMIDRARRAAEVCGMPHVRFLEGDATSLPVADESVDVVMSNGVLNLVPEKNKAFAEIVRVLRPGGRLHLADITVSEELSDDIRSNVDLWTG